MFRRVSTDRYIPLLPKVVPLLAVLALLAACGQVEAGAVTPPQERTIYMAAIEPKGGTTVDKEPFPAQSLPPGGSYGLKAPDDTGRWQVETYRFDPGTVVVNEGDTVTLEIVGINGKEHPITIDGYGLSTVLKRGEVRRLKFLADKPGIFRVMCAIHKPSMEAALVVLKR